MLTLVAIVPAMTAIVFLKLSWRAGAVLAVVNWLIHTIATSVMSYLIAPRGISSFWVRELILAAAYWMLIALMILVFRRVTRTINWRIDIQTLRSFPWPILAIFCVSLYNVWAAQGAAVSAGPLPATRVTALLLAVIGLGLFFSSYQSQSQSQENQELKFYLQTIETLTVELRQFRHNYRNILHGMSGYIENQEWDELTAYFRDVVRETEQAELNSYALALKNVTNYALFGLLSEKLTYAKQLGVDMDLSVLGIFGHTDMSASDLCQVIGIFLDNAIEAAEGVPKGKVLVTLRYDGSYQQIAISNDCSRKPALSKANTGGYSSKGPGRGSGLYYAKRLLDKYEHVLHNTIYDDGQFRQELIIPVDLPL